MGAEYHLTPLIVGRGVRSAFTKSEPCKGSFDSLLEFIWDDAINIAINTWGGSLLNRNPTSNGERDDHSALITSLTNLVVIRGVR